MFKYIYKNTKLKYSTFTNRLKISFRKFSFRINSAIDDGSTPVNSYDVDMIRNIGIIAHIDAGKTTTTERMLFYSGVIMKPGEVHDGNTVTDFMQQERERGITIRAAAVSFDWKGYQVNLIDTPGHIDFTAEVERSLRVLDGAVVIFDASMGVETQTITVWKQADKYSLPRIAYINKIDKAGASVENTLFAIHKKLGLKPIMINYPNGEENQFSGLIDLITFKQVKFSDQLGVEIDQVDIDKNDKNYSKYLKLRETLIEELVSHDETLMGKYLEGEPIEIEEIIIILRRLIIQNKIVLVLCGSSLKNKGVQQILDSIVSFLPSPLDTKPTQAKLFSNNNLIPKHCINKGPACGIIFKIINDKDKGTIAFFKLYEGTLKNKTTLTFIQNNKISKEKIVQLVRVKADEAIQLNSIHAGDIGGIVGLKNVNSGDTFIDTENEAEFCELPGVFTPEAVFFCSIYPKRNNELRALMAALDSISKEDPSIRIKQDKETAQTLLCGLGELHLEIIRDRIEIEYGISPVLGKMKVSFREGIRKNGSIYYKLEKDFNGKRLYFEIELEVYPLENNISADDTDNAGVDNLLENKHITNLNKKFIFSINRYTNVEVNKENELGLIILNEHNQISYTISFDFEKLESKTEYVKYDDGEEETFKSLDQLIPDYKRYLFECITDSLKCGSLMGYENVSLGIRVKNGKYSTSRTDDLSVKICIAEATKQLLAECEPTFMEPFMLLDIVIPNPIASDVISDLSRRRGKILTILCENDTINISKKDKFLYEYLIEDKNMLTKQTNDDLITKIYALAPLTEMVGYPNFIRSISKGEAKFFMKFYNYDYVGQQLHEKIIDQTYFYE